MSIIRTRPAALAAGGLALTAALVLAAPLAASAHVHVDPVRAKAGADHVDLGFSVPNEIPKASTTELAIALPAGFSTATPTAVRGWKASVDTSGSTRTVRFRATGDGIGDGQTQVFTVRVGPVPSVGSVPIPVAQTYSDGTVVHWDEPTPASGEEPEHPAPTLYVNDTPPADHDEDAEGAEHADAAATPAASTDPAAGIGVVLGATGLAVGVVALVLAALALLRSRRGGRA